jgi:hypothetical protein
MAEGKPSAAPIEIKAAAPVSTTLVAGYIAWAIIYFVPGAKDNIPADLQGQLPVIIATVLAAVAGYYVPHTHRPDLVPPEPVPGGRVPRARHAGTEKP